LLPIPTVSIKEEFQLTDILDKLIVAPDEEKPYLITTINEYIYTFFAFTEEEISFIEKAIEGGAH
jgi:hypothetical protein